MKNVSHAMSNVANMIADILTEEERRSDGIRLIRSTLIDNLVTSRLNMKSYIWLLVISKWHSPYFTNVLHITYIHECIQIILFHMKSSIPYTSKEKSNLVRLNKNFPCYFIDGIPYQATYQTHGHDVNQTKKAPT